MWFELFSQLFFTSFSFFLVHISFIITIIVITIDFRALSSSAYRDIEFILSQSTNCCWIADRNALQDTRVIAVRHWRTIYFVKNVITFLEMWTCYRQTSKQEIELTIFLENNSFVYELKSKKLDLYCKMYLRHVMIFFTHLLIINAISISDLRALTMFWLQIFWYHKFSKISESYSITISNFATIRYFWTDICNSLQTYCLIWFAEVISTSISLSEQFNRNYIKHS